MPPTISLRDLVGELQTLDDELHAYLNKVTGELITISDDDISMAEDVEEDELNGWEADLVQDVKKVQSSDDYLELPSKFDLDEYSIMERFCSSLADVVISELLLEKIRGKGAFHRFKQAIAHYGIEQDWFKFESDAYKEIAIAWLEEHQLTYQDDL